MRGCEFMNGCEFSGRKAPSLLIALFIILIVNILASTQVPDISISPEAFADQFPDIYIPDDTLFIGMGDAWMGGEADLTIYNHGSGVLEIYEISSDTPQFYSEQRSLAINGHDYADIIIVFDPEIEPTDYHVDSAVFTIVSNDPDEGELSVFVHAGFTPWYIRGDVTGDGVINVLDVLAVSNYILSLLTLTGDAY